MTTIQEKVRLLEQELQQTNDEVIKVDLLNSIAYELRHTDSARSVQKSITAGEIADKINYQKGFANSLLNKGFAEMVQANYATAFETLQNALDIFEQLTDKQGQAHALYNIGVVYSRIAEYNQALESFQQSLAIRQSLGDRTGEASCLMQLAYINERFGSLEESYDHYARALAIQRQTGDQAGMGTTLLGLALIKQKRKEYAETETDLLESLSIRAAMGETHGWLVSMNYLGEFYLSQNETEKARAYLTEAIEIAEKQVPPFPANLCRLYTSLSKVYVALQHFENAIKYLHRALQFANENNLKYQVYDIHFTLADLYKKQGNFERALASYEQYHETKEESINLAASTKLKNLQLVNEIEVEKRKAEIHRLTNIELKNAYDKLKRTQEQLIQAEKLAYLGELTAGIAHEIQNPLNFVINFSEVNKDLIKEVILDKVNTFEFNAAERESMIAIEQNNGKIYSHAKRAEAIVKSMLQHSRSSKGEKELTDINALTDECLRLSYHGIRAKNKFINATLHTNYEEGMQKLLIAPQDVSRVLLNLCNNALYAVNQRKNADNRASETNFEPTIWLTTKSVHTRDGVDCIEISIKDNGNGVPKKIVNKIFQPFFTTKPPGEGTGLGLSLSYEIIKGHGGEIKVKTKEGEGTEFIVQLPMEKPTK